MANKNQKAFRTLVYKSAKSGAADFAINMPTHNYHNFTAGVFRVRRVEHFRPDKNGVVSANVRRNTQEKVYVNESDKGKQSLTVHENIHKTIPMIFKNHGYLVKDEYERNNYKNAANIR